MINLDELKPIVEELLDGREDGADYVDRISALDKPAEVDRSEIDALNKSWNERYMKAFFGGKAEDLTGKPLTEPAEGAPDGEEGGEDKMEQISIDDLFTEKKED